MKKQSTTTTKRTTGTTKLTEDLGRSYGSTSTTTTTTLNDSFSVVSNMNQVRLVAKRFIFSRRGQLVYLCWICTILICSILLIMLSLIQTTDRTRRHAHVYKLVWWVQCLEGLVDFTFIVEIFGRAVILQDIFWNNPMSYVDIFIAFGCISTYVLYNVYKRDTFDARGEEIENAIYICRQTIRFIRCMYFFMWFSESLIEFQRHARDKDDVVFFEETDANVAIARDPFKSRMISPFVRPILEIQVEEEHDRRENNSSAFDDARRRREHASSSSPPPLIRIQTKKYSIDVAEDEPGWWQDMEESTNDVVVYESVIVSVEGMTCADCSNTLREALFKLKGVERIEIHLCTDGISSVRVEGTATYEKICAVIEACGFVVSEEEY